MMNPKTLSSPNPNVAQRTVVALADGTTKVKEAIVKALNNNITQEELTKELNKIIADTVDKFESLELQEDMRKALVVSARKWHYQLSESYKILNANLAINSRKNGFNLGVFSIGINTNNNLITRFRPYLDSNSKGLAIIEDYEKKVKTALKALSAEPPKVVKVNRKDGKEYTYTMSARNRAEIASRYEANLKDLQDLISKGVKYVWTTSHPNCSLRCQPHQGKLYSLDPTDKRGNLNGHSYTFLGDVLALNNGNSIINGYNCRHRLVEYQSNSHAPDEYTESEIKKEYSIDARQRSYENQIRQLKTEERLARANGDIEYASQLRKQWRTLTKNYEIFSLNNSRAYYPWRTRISDEEVDFGYRIRPTEIDTKLYEVGLDRKGTIENSIVLTNERYKHVMQRHPELKGKEKDIAETIKNPDFIFKDSGITQTGEARRDSVNVTKFINGKHIIVSIKLMRENNKGYYNSIITVRESSTKKFEKFYKKNNGNLLYKKNK